MSNILKTFIDVRGTHLNTFLINEKFPLNSCQERINSPFFNITGSLFFNINYESVVSLYLIFKKIISYTNLKQHPDNFKLLYDKFLSHYNKQNINYNLYVLEDTLQFKNYHKSLSNTWNLKLIFKILTTKIFENNEEKNEININDYTDEFDLLRNWPEIEIYRKIFLETYDELTFKYNNLPNIIDLNNFGYQLYEYIDYTLTDNITNDIDNYLHKLFDLYPNNFIALIKNNDHIMKENYIYFNSDRNQMLYVFNSKDFDNHIKKYRHINFNNKVHGGLRAFKRFLANISDSKNHEFFK